MQSLADFLGTAAPQVEAPERELSPADALTGKAFADAVLNSREFRQYILNGIVLGDLPAQIICRLMDHGWGKVPDKLEVKDRTNDLESVSSEQLEQRALHLATLARSLRVQESQEGSISSSGDEDAASQVH